MKEKTRGQVTHARGSKKRRSKKDEWRKRREGRERKKRERKPKKRGSRRLHRSLERIRDSGNNRRRQQGRGLETEYSEYTKLINHYTFLIQ